MRVLSIVALVWLVVGTWIVVGCSAVEDQDSQSDLAEQESRPDEIGPRAQNGGGAETRGPDLRLGMSRRAVTELMGSRGTPMFRIAQENKAQGNKSVECVTYSFAKPYNRLYFVFKDSALVSILDPVPFNKKGYRPHPSSPGSRIEYELPWRTDERIASIVTANSMTPAEVAVSIERFSKRDRQRKDDPGIRLAFALTAPLVRPYLSNLDSKRRSWAATFDAAKVELGLERSAVESHYGNANFMVRRADGSTTRAYGPAETVYTQGSKRGVGHLDRKFWTIVVYEGDTVVGILNNDLFNVDTIVTLTQRVR